MSGNEFRVFDEERENPRSKAKPPLVASSFVI